MNRRERLLATLRGKPVDRPAVSFYELNGLDQNPDNPDPLNIYSHPSWRPLLELTCEKTDCIVMRGVAFKEIAPDPIAHLAKDETWLHDGSVFTRRTIVAGNRTLTMQTRRDRDVDTIWTTEHLLKGPDDLRAFLALPPAMAGGVVDAGPFLAAEAALGDAGIVMIDTPDPLCLAALLFDMGEYTVTALTERALFHQLLERFATTLLAATAEAARRLPGRLWRIYGPEFATAPYLPPALFREYVCRYDKPLIDIIHGSGGYARVHAQRPAQGNPRRHRRFGGGCPGSDRAAAARRRRAGLRAAAIWRTNGVVRQPGNQRYRTPAPGALRRKSQAGFARRHIRQRARLRADALGGADRARTALGRLEELRSHRPSCRTLRQKDRFMRLQLIVRMALTFVGLPALTGLALGEDRILENQAICFRIGVRDGKVILRDLKNRLTGATTSLPLEQFTLELQDGTTIGSSACTLRSSATDRLGLELLFISDRSPGMEIRVRYRLPPGKPYLRKQIAVRQVGGTPGRLLRADLDEWRGVRRNWDSMHADRYPYGSHPIYCEDLWAGVEFVAAFSEYGKDGFVLRSRPGGTPLGREWLELHSTVAGVAVRGGVRDAFLRYIDDIRLAPPRMTWCYNSWWTLPERFDSAQLVALASQWNERLFQRHGTFFDVLTLDAGWSELQSLWEIDRHAFPDGFGPVRRLVESAGGRLGLWISPSGIYAAALSPDWARRSGLTVISKREARGARVGHLAGRSRLSPQDPRDALPADPREPHCPRQVRRPHPLRGQAAS